MRNVKLGSIMELLVITCPKLMILKKSYFLIIERHIICERYKLI